MNNLIYLLIIGRLFCSSERSVPARPLLYQTRVHEFSDQVKKDTFKLVMTGASIIKSKVTFQVIAFNHKKIFEQHFTGIDLLGDLEDMPWPAKRKEDTIRKHFNSFFQISAFVKPAIAVDEKWDPDYVLKIDFDDIKKDRQATGFFYSYGYESSFEIAYSKKRKKVVTCFAAD